MRILLIAYDFPPLSTPQALRWAYLCRGLADLGIDVDVLAPELRADMEGAPALPPEVRVHRCSPGPIQGFIGDRARRRQARPDSGGSSPFPSEPPASPISNLNWKGRLFRLLQSSASLVQYPDLRKEWIRPASAMLKRLLSENRYDVVVSSYEPAMTVQIGLQAKQRGLRWVVDMGDPILAQYTPTRWRRKASNLEHMACALADAITVTNEPTRALLMRRYPRMTAPTSVISQGHDMQAGDSFENGGLLSALNPSKLNLFYAGRFYHFRNPAALLDAVAENPDVVLWIATPDMPMNLRRRIESIPKNVVLLGSLPHSKITQIMRVFDALVVIGNENPVQTPGKLYEYIGARKPILYITYDERDTGLDLAIKTGLGIHAENGKTGISERLAHLSELKKSGQLSIRYRGDDAIIDSFSWRKIALRYARVLSEVAGHAR
jgi:glycosyltransferase involved in cell wall biosynthesis